MKKWFIAVVLVASVVVGTAVHAQTKLLTPEEELWLKSRNNTIVVYPEKNFPPYSYQSSSGRPQGLSIDYIELIAEKVGAKVTYLPARPLSQIFDDVTSNDKADVVTSLTDTKERQAFLYFTDTYISAPAVIVMRKDLYKGTYLTLDDLTGKKVAIGDSYAVEGFVRGMNSRIVIESVPDDEFALQQVVLGEVDAAIMDITSLSYYLSKQVLSSVVVAGSTGFEYKFAFAVPKNKEILQSILEKGLSQISAGDRAVLTQKWVTIPEQQPRSWWSVVVDRSGVVALIIVCALGLIGILVKVFRYRHIPLRYIRKRRRVDALKDEMSELEYASKEIADELKDIKEELREIE